MDKPLEGIRVVEVAMWAFVPSAGGVLADWGAEVIKIEAPTGDPIRGLVSSGSARRTASPTPGSCSTAASAAWRSTSTNRSRRRSCTSSPRAPTSFSRACLPPAWRKLGIDHDAIRAANPQIIYVVGRPRGAWSGSGEGRVRLDHVLVRGAVSASVTPAGSSPIGMPAGVFGDSLSGVALAGGIVAALSRKAKTGEGSLVDGSLLGTAMWSMQMAIVGAAVAGLAELPKGSRAILANPLVNNYQTKDERWLALCMLQPDVYWGDCAPPSAAWT